MRMLKKINTEMESLKEILKWGDLDVKTKIAYVTAIIAFALGWGLTVAGFVIGAGVVSDSVLWILGQSLVYTASVFGVGMYVTGEVRGMKRNIRRFIREEERAAADEAGYEQEETEYDN